MKNPKKVRKKNSNDFPVTPMTQHRKLRGYVNSVGPSQLHNTIHSEKKQIESQMLTIFGINGSSIILSSGRKYKRRIGLRNFSCNSFT